MQKKHENQRIFCTYNRGGEHMKIRTYTQLEAILRTAFDVEGNSIKTVAEMANINLNTLYKWNCGAMRFSPDNIDNYSCTFKSTNLSVLVMQKGCMTPCAALSKESPSGGRPENTVYISIIHLSGDRVSCRFVWALRLLKDSL